MNNIPENQNIDSSTKTNRNILQKVRNVAGAAAVLALAACGISDKGEAAPATVATASANTEAKATTTPRAEAVKTATPRPEAGVNAEAQAVAEKLRNRAQLTAESYAAKILKAYDSPKNEVQEIDRGNDLKTLAQANPNTTGRFAIVTVEHTVVDNINDQQGNTYKSAKYRLSAVMKDGTEQFDPKTVQQVKVEVLAHTKPEEDIAYEDAENLVPISSFVLTKNTLLGTPGGNHDWTVVSSAVGSDNFEADTAHLQDPTPLASFEQATDEAQQIFAKEFASANAAS